MTIAGADMGTVVAEDQEEVRMTKRQTWVATTPIGFGQRCAAAAAAAAATPAEVDRATAASGTGGGKALHHINNNINNNNKLNNYRKDWYERFKPTDSLTNSLHASRTGGRISINEATMYFGT